jgi:hypothetical protein
MVDSKLADSIRSMQELELRAQDLEMLMVVIKAKRTDLKNSQGRLRDQLKLIEHDLGMGARWGNNAPPSLAAGAATDIDDLLNIADEGGAWSKDFEVGTGDEVDGDEDPSPHVELSSLDLEEDSTETEEDEEAEEFGEDSGEDDDSEEIEEAEEADDATILADDDEAEPMPEGSSSDDEVDAFLDSIEDASEVDTETPEDRHQPDIEDLISSLTE